MGVMLLLGAFSCVVASEGAPRTLALQEFELLDDMREYASEEARREDERRVALASAELAKEFERRHLYRVMQGRTSMQEDAERIARCWVQKVSNLILNLNIEVRSAATGEVLYTRSVDIRGNTDESWLRGVRRLVDDIDARRQHLR